MLKKMNSKFKYKLFDIVNSSLYENSIRKSENNIFTSNDIIIQRRIQTSYSSPKYKNNKSYFDKKRKDDIKEMINKSLNDLGINDIKKLNKKSLFDDIQTTINKKLIVPHKEFDYEKFFSKINDKKKRQKEKKNKFLNNHSNIQFNQINNIFQNYKDNGRLMRKISDLKSEMKNNTLFLEKSNKINLENNNLSQKNLVNNRFLNLSKENLNPKNNNILWYNELSSYHRFKNYSSINNNYKKPKSLKYSYDKSKIFIKDQNDKIIDKFMNKNALNNNEYFSNQKKNNSKKLNLNF